MPLAPADRSLLDPTSLAAHSFATGFRGYDQDEVRRFLGQVADAVGRLIDAQAGLERRLAAAESRAAAPRPFDEAELASALGEETARVLVAARQAATDIRVKAEEGAARLLEEAANEAAATRRAADEHAAKERAAVAELRRTAEAELAKRRSEAEIENAEAGRAAEAAAAEVRAAAAADVERLLEDARADADARRADAIAAAAAARAEADAEVSRRRADAEAQREVATEEGRARVEEAQLVRERVLKDLARRRRTARGQLEQLRVARERLLEAYEVVRRTVDEATGELRVALPEARLAAEEAGRQAEAEPEVTVDNLEAELEMARAAGLPIVMVDDRAAAPSPAPGGPAADPSPTDAVDEAAAEAGDELDSAADPIPAVGAVPDVRITGAVVAGEAVESAPVDQPEPDGADTGLQPEPPTADAPLPVATSIAADRPGTAEAPAGPESPASPGPGQAMAAERGAEAEAPEPDGTPPITAVEASPEPVEASSEPVGEPEPVGEAEAIAAGPGAPAGASEEPAREPVGDETGSESEIPGPTVVPPPVDEPAPGDDVVPGDGSPERSGQVHDEAAVRAEVDELFARIRASREAGATTAGPADPTEAASAAPGSEASAEAQSADGGMVTLLERRDAAIEEVEHRLARRLKRVLADEQSAVLDTVRRSRSLPHFDDVLPSTADHVATYVEAARDDLTAAAEAGARFAGGSPPPDGAGVDDLAAGLADELTGRLRPRLERCFLDTEADDDDGRDEDELTNRVRACYREWKTTQVAEVARHVVLAAFSRGQYDALPAGTLLQWVIDDSGQPCPDAEDNALAGAVGKGEPFPTGHCCPPAHPGCRCLVVPARR